MHIKLKEADLKIVLKKKKKKIVLNDSLDHGKILLNRSSKTL